MGWVILKDDESFVCNQFKVALTWNIFKGQALLLGGFIVSTSGVLEFEFIQYFFSHFIFLTFEASFSYGFVSYDLSVALEFVWRY